MSPRWSMDMTFQPDFAQVEVDDEVINLSDYPVFLTEKRPFFIEGLDLFHESGVRLLYTRRIADPLYGARLTGQENKVRTSGVYARNDDPDHGLEHTGAARTQINFGERSTAGFTFTHLNRDSHAITSGGVDGAVRWGNRNELVLNLAAVDKPGKTRQPVSVHANLFTEPVKDTEVLYDFGYFGQDFDINDLGWMSYSDQLWNWGRVEKKMFPEESRIERWTVSAEGYHEMHPDLSYNEGHGNLAGWVNIDYEWYFGIEGEIGNTWRRKYLDTDEIPHPDAAVLEDNYGLYTPEYYRTFEIGTWFETDTRQTWAYGTELDYNSLRDGSRVEFSPYLTVTPRSNLLIDINFDWARVWDVYDINDGNRTDFRILRVRGDWSPTLNTSFRATFQFVDNSDDIDGLIANMVYAWNWSPGSWIYFVYREDREYDRAVVSIPGDRTFRIKATWLFRVGA